MITTIWSEMLITSFMSCSISNTVTLCSLRSGDQRLEVVGLLRVEAGGRLVEHEDPRAGHHAAGDLQASLLAIGEGAGAAVGELGKVDFLQPVRGVLHGLALAAAECRGLEQAGEEVGVEVAVLGDQQVLHRGHFLEQADVLEGPHHALRAIL